MRIDCHNHFWQFQPVRDAWITEEMQVLRKDFLPADLQMILEKEQVAGTVAVQADESDRETEWLLELAGQHDFIRGVVGWTDLNAKSLPDVLRRYQLHTKLKGFRTITQGKPEAQFFGNKDFIQGVRQLHQFDFTYDLLIYHDQFPEAIRFTDKCPDQPFMLDHLGKPAIAAKEIKKWREHMRILSANPNVYCKLSGIITEADWKKWRYEDLSPYLDIAGEFFGVHRLCFGSDWPVCLLAGSYGQVAGILHRFLEQVRPEEREKVWGANAIRFYGLDVPETGDGSTSETHGID